MKFELSPVLIDCIIFGMENQQSEHVLDTLKLQVLPAAKVLPEALELEDRVIPIPEWTSVDGFRLMEGFVSGLHNPLMREELRYILQSGRGVFRQFKDFLRQRKDVERLWYRFKEREMRRRVYEWYNQLRDFWGLEPLAWEATDDTFTKDLVLWDFEFKSLSPDYYSQIPEWDRQFFYETYPEFDSDTLALLYTRYRRHLPTLEQDDSSRFWAAYTAGGDLAGFLWYRNLEAYDEIIQLGVFEDYRGLGIGKTLLNQVVYSLGFSPEVKNETGLADIDVEEKTGTSGAKRELFIDIPEGAGFLTRDLGQYSCVKLHKTFMLRRLGS